MDIMMKNTDKIKLLKKEVRKFGIQDLTDIQVMDSIQTANINLKNAGGQYVEVKDGDIKLLTAMIVAVWFSFKSKKPFEDHLMEAINKIVPNELTDDY